MTAALSSLWELSLLLCSAALLAIAALLLARIIGERIAIVRNEYRAQLLPQLLRGEPADLDKSRLARKVAADLTTELVEIVRGSDRNGFIAVATLAGASEELARRLRSHAPQDRLVAAEALAKFPDFSDHVREVALTDPSADVRLGAALALAQEGRAPPVGQLVRSLGIGTREQSLLVISLMRDLALSDPHAVEALLYDLDVPDAAKLAATDALANSGAVDHAPLVAWMSEASEEENDLRPRIFRALGRIGHPSGHAAILGGLDSEEWAVRTAAAEATGRSAIRDAVPRLAEMLDDEEWWVRFRAAEALTRLGVEGRVALHRAAIDQRPVVRDTAKTILAEQRAA